MKPYVVYLDGQSIGDACIKQEGLYYRISCRCVLPKENMYRLMICCDAVKIDLGICTPKGDRFGVEKDVPVKKLGKGDFSFTVIPHGKNAPAGRYVQIEQDKPFADLKNLESAHFVMRNGVPGLIIL